MTESGRKSFTDTPDFSADASVIPKQDLFAANPPAEALSGPARKAALASVRMRWEVPDAVPYDELNRILWHTAMGWSTPYLGVKRSAFWPLSLEPADGECGRIR